MKFWQAKRAKYFMGAERFELSRVAPYAPEAYAYTNSATRPQYNVRVLPIVGAPMRRIMGARG